MEERSMVEKSFERHAVASGQLFFVLFGWLLVSISAGAGEEPVDTSVSQPKMKTGSFQLTFAEHGSYSGLYEIAKRMSLRVDRNIHRDRYYSIQDESFEVVIPESYSFDTPHGLIVAISPGDSGNVPWNKLPDLLAKYKLIWICANRSGNEHDVYTRRIPLALDAYANMTKQYNINEKRVYLSGISGGGRVASMIAFHYSDLFAGGVFMIGANYWDTLEVPGKKGYFFKATFMKPHLSDLLRARNNGRYVFITGDFDANREEMHAYYEKGYKVLLKKTQYIQVPGMGHETPPLEEYERALQFLDEPFQSKSGS